MIRYQDLLTLLVDAEPLGAAVLQPDGTMCRANARFADKSQQWTVDPASLRFVARAARSASPMTGSLVLVGSEGTTRKIACNARGFQLEGRGLHVLVRESRAHREFSDLTGHFRTLEAELHKTGAELGTLRSVFDATPDAILLLGTDGQLLRSNPAAISMFGDEARAAVFARTLDLDTHHRKEARAGDSSAVTILELTAWHGDRHFPVEVTARRARVAGEDMWIICVRDLSDRKGLERALERAKLLEDARDRAEQARMAKTRFLATVSHELRTPLHGVNSALELALTRLPADASERRLIDLAYRSCRAALDQVNRILEISRIEGRELADHPRRVFDLVATVANVCSETRLIAERKAVQFQASLPAEPVLIDSHEHLVRQLVQNLVSNAIKFTSEGHVAVSLAVEWDMFGRASGLLCVEDSGIGFDVEDLSRLKQEFETGDASFRRIEDGAGLGLALVEQALQALGGTMEVQSQPGAGSSFKVRMPLDIRAEPVAPEMDPTPADGQMAEGLVILLAEDNEINAEILKDLLESLGAKVCTAYNGAQAIAHAAARQFDIILMDVSMPGVDGMAATREIRRHGENMEALIVGLTAHCDEDVKWACRDAGMDDVHTKPISIATLRSILRGEISAALRAAPPAATAPDPRLLPGTLSGGQPETDMRMALGAEKFEAYRRKLLMQFGESLEEFSGLLSVAGFDQIAQLAHKHIGALSFIGEARIVEALRKLEAAAKEKSAGVCVASIATLAELAERAKLSD